MTISIKIKHIVIIVSLSTIALGSYIYKDPISAIFINKAQKSVDKALLYFKDQHPEESKSALSLFGADFMTKLLSKYSYYKIGEWNLIDKGDRNGKCIILVEGRTVN